MKVVETDEIEEDFDVDLMLKTLAEEAIQAALKRREAAPEEPDVADFGKAKMKGNGASAKWLEGSRAGMVFKKGDKCIGYYKDGQTRVVSLAEELTPMRGCTPMRLEIEELLNATPKEAKEAATKNFTGDGERKTGKKIA